MTESLKTIKSVLIELHALSNRQLEQLDHESYDDMAALVNQKGLLLVKLGEEIRLANANGFEIGNAKQSEKSQPKYAELCEINELLRKFQALDKYIVQQAAAHKEVIGNKLQKILSTKSMSESYFSRNDKPKLLDKAV